MELIFQMTRQGSGGDMMDELISRKALKEAIAEYHAGLFPRYISKLVDAEIADIQDIIDEQAAVLAGIKIAVVAILVLVFVIGWVKNRYF